MPIWTYDIQLWGMAKLSNLNKIQSSINHFTHNNKNHLYTSNYELHTDLYFKTISDTSLIIHKSYYSHL